MRSLSIVRLIFIFACTFLFGVSLWASPDFLTLQSRIVQPDGQNLEAVSVNYRISITDPVGTCVVYQEDYSNVSMVNSKGLVAIKIGSGVKSHPVAPTTMKDIFTNFNSPVFNCQSGGTYTAASSDQRKLVMQFNDGNGWQTVPGMEINSVPFALESLSSQKLGAFPAGDYVRAAQFATCGAGEAVHFNGTNFTCVVTGGAATSVAAGAGLVGTPSISFSGDTNTGFYSGAADTISISNNGSNTFNITASTLASTTTGGASITQTNGTAGAPTFAFTGDADTGWFRAAADTLAASTAGAERIRIDSAGNVGVGTTTPTSSLQIDLTKTSTLQNTKGISSNVTYAPSGATSMAAMGIDVITTYAPAGAANTNSVVYGGNFLARDSAGNSSAINTLVGINTQINHISNGTVQTAAATRSQLDATSAGGTITDAYGTKSSIYSSDSTIGNAYGTHSSVTTYPTAGSVIIAGFGGYFDVQKGAGSTLLNAYGVYTGGIQGTNKWSIYASDAAAPSYFSGNVGIGTTAPIYPLQVASSVTSDSTVGIDSNVNTYSPLAAFGSGIGGNMSITFNGSADPLIIAGSQGNATNTSTTNVPNTIVGGNFTGKNKSTNSAPSVVGVAATAYQQLAGTITSAIALSGTVNKSAGTITNGYGLYLFDVNATNGWGVYQAGADDKNYFAGNVGIGTTSPQTTLQVEGVISPATNNTFTLGNASYRFTEVYATNGVINTSDRREKKDIYDTDLGLDFINKLRPVSYRWNTGVDDDVHYGLIAQEAEHAIAEVGKTEKTSIVTRDEATDRYGVRYSELISPLIKAAQELYIDLLGVKAVNEIQARQIASKADKEDLNAVKAEAKTEIEKIKAENLELKARFDRQQKELAAQQRELATIKKKLGL